MRESFFIVTDSGGIQEEAPYLEKPVLVLRNETERVEGINHGVAKLIGTQEDAIYQSMQELLDSDSVRNSMINKDINLYGDGKSSERITDELYKLLLPQSLLLSP